MSPEPPPSKEEEKKKEKKNDLAAQIVKSQYSEAYAKRILENLKTLASLQSRPLNPRSGRSPLASWLPGIHLLQPCDSPCRTEVPRPHCPLDSPTHPAYALSSPPQGLDSVDKKEDIQKFFVSRSVAKLLPRGVRPRSAPPPWRPPSPLRLPP